MNEQTKTHLEHAEQIAKITAQFEERKFMCDLLHDHINKLNREIEILKTQKQVASECHDSRIKSLRNADIKICQLTATFKDIIERLEYDQDTTNNESLREYLEVTLDAAHAIYFQHNGVYFWQLND
jgi:hypothetical protein